MAKTIEEIIKEKEEKEIINRCIEYKVYILIAKIARIKWKNEGIEAALGALDELHNRGCIILS